MPGEELILTPDSPGVGQGMNLIGLNFDKENNIRPQPFNSLPDLGAYEIDQNLVSTAETEEDLVVVYPNPTSNHIYFSDLADQVKLSDLKGRIIARKRNTSSVDLSELEKGIYLLEFVIAAKKSTVKIVKE